MSKWMKVRGVKVLRGIKRKKKMKTEQCIKGSIELRVRRVKRKAREYIIGTSHIGEGGNGCHLIQFDGQRKRGGGTGEGCCVGRLGRREGEGRVLQRDEGRRTGRGGQRAPLRQAQRRFI